MIMSKSKWRKRERRNEDEFGISILVGGGENEKGRFEALFKDRYSDFHVSEIDKNGQIIRLTSLGSSSSTQEQEEDVPDDVLHGCSTHLISPENQAKIIELRKEVVKNIRTKTVVELIVTTLDKVERGNIHKWIRELKVLNSETKDKGLEKYIIISGGKIKKRGTPERGKYVHCTLFKEGCDTLDAINKISNFLRLKPSLINYAGTKDKQAKTSQRISIPNIEINRLIGVSKQLRYLKLGNFEYKAKPLFLGDLKGNHFKILLKNVTLLSRSSENNDTDTDADDQITSMLESLKSKGFINYYGLQRFGSYKTSTHLIGKAILQNKLEEAFDLILTPKENDQQFLKEAKQIWSERKDLKKMSIPKWFQSVESNLLFGLLKYYEKKDLQSAFACIPRNMRTLYIHSFQSFMWNHAASYRIKEFGLNPIVGDLVYEDTEEAVEDLEGETDESTVPAPDVDKPNINSFDAKVKIIKEEDLQNYTIFDVIIPLYGKEVAKYMPGYILHFYNELLVKFDMPTDFFKSYKPRTDIPKGAYRKLLVLPTNFNYQISNYYDGENLDTFIKSDYDLLQEARYSAKNGKKGEEIEIEKDSTKVRNKKCVFVEFSLPSSSYATMALREIMKEKVDVEDNEDPNEPEAKKVKLSQEPLDLCLVVEEPSDKN